MLNNQKEMFYMSIGERIIQMRTRQELSQGDLAKLIGVSRQAVSKWENDQSSPDTLKLIKLADILDTDIEYLATGKIEPKEQAPIVVNLVKQDEKIVERIVEKTVEVPVTKKIYRVKYVRNPFEFFLIGAAGFILGILLGVIL